jgi:chromate reductase
LVVTTSAGALGGARAQASLKYVLTALLARTFAWQEIVVPQANDKMKDGVLDDPAFLTFAAPALQAFLADLPPRG